MNKLDFAAHVDHAVTHGASSGTLLLGAAGAVIAAVIVVAAAPEAITVAIIAEAAGAASLHGKIGMAVGGVVDTFLAPSVSGHLKSGIPTVFLGPHIKQAARADEVDTWADCDGQGAGSGWEGSRTVMLGKEHEPMSRRTDRLKCQGVISEGERTIFVGGPASHEGEALAEADRASVQLLSSVLDLLDLGESVGTGAAFSAAVKGAAFVANQSGHEDVGAVLGGVPLGAPTSLAGAYQQAADSYNGVVGASNLVTGPSE